MALNLALQAEHVSSDGDCFFESIVAQFSDHWRRRKLPGRLTIALQRYWIAQFFQNPKKARPALQIWEQLYRENPRNPEFSFMREVLQHRQPLVLIQNLVTKNSFWANDLAIQVIADNLARLFKEQVSIVLLRQGNPGDTTTITSSCLGVPPLPVLVTYLHYKPGQHFQPLTVHGSRLFEKRR